MTRRTVAYPRADVIEVLRTLNTVVVSLDRIGSATAGLPDAEQARTAGEFVMDWDVARKLARARRVLSDAFSRRLGPDLMDELERELHDTPHWTASARKPPRTRRERPRRA